MDLQKILEIWGLPTLMLIALGYFLANQVWPFIIDRVRRAEEATSATNKAFVDSINQITVAHLAESRELVIELKEISRQSGQNFLATQELTRTISAMNDRERNERMAR